MYFFKYIFRHVGSELIFLLFCFYKPTGAITYVYNMGREGILTQFSHAKLI